MSDLTDKTMEMLKYNHHLTKKYQGGLKFGIGNCFAKLVFLISEFDNEFIYLLERLLPKFGMEVADVYITPFYKFVGRYSEQKEQNKILLTEIFQTEMLIVEPYFIVIADEIDLDMPDAYPYERVPELTEIMRLEKELDYDKKTLIKKQKYILSRLEEIINNF